MPRKDCEMCGGSGSYEIPSEQIAGVIVDSSMVECDCQCPDCGSLFDTHLGNCPQISKIKKLEKEMINKEKLVEVIKEYLVPNVKYDGMHSDEIAEIIIRDCVTHFCPKCGEEVQNEDGMCGDCAK